MDNSAYHHIPPSHAITYYHMHAITCYHITCNHIHATTYIPSHTITCHHMLSHAITTSQAITIKNQKSYEMFEVKTIYFTGVCPAARSPSAGFRPKYRESFCIEAGSIENFPSILTVCDSELSDVRVTSCLLEHCG